MGKSTELMQLLKTGNSDAARKLISKLRKSGKLFLLTSGHCLRNGCTILVVYCKVEGGLCSGAVMVSLQPPVQLD